MEVNVCFILSVLLIFSHLCNKFVTNNLLIKRTIPKMGVMILMKKILVILD
jgi:hypothetical protein